MNRGQLPTNQLHVYCRSGFECEILLIANCEFLYKTQSKESQEKDAMNSTRDHTPFAQAHMLAIANMHAFSISCVFNLLACMYLQQSIVENEISSIL